MKEELRKENNCLNCGTELIGPYCHVCGQKNLELHVGFFALIGELIADYFHFDARVFANLNLLLFRPGFLINQFNSGKRVKYVHPFRLFIFVTILFFVLYFSFHSSSSNLFDRQNYRISSADSIAKIVRDSLREAMKGDTFAARNINSNIVGRPNQTFLDSSSGFSVKHLPRTYDLYVDSVRRLSSDKRPKWFMRAFVKQYYRAKEMGDNNFFKAILEQFEHDLPRMLFFLVPVIALILKLLYVRRHIYYINHLVFALYTHAFVFILLIFSIPLSYFRDFTGWIVLISLVYILLSMRNVYKQGWGKTILKLFIFLLLYSVFLGLAMGLTMLFAAATV